MAGLLLSYHLFADKWMKTYKSTEGERGQGYAGTDRDRKCHFV